LDILDSFISIIFLFIFASFWSSAYFPVACYYPAQWHDNWMAPWKNRISSTTMKLRKSLVTWRGKIYRVVRFFHPRSSCTTHLMLFAERPLIYASSCMMISGERTEQLDIFYRVTGFTSDFRPPQMSADICFGHDDLGWKNRTTRCNRFLESWLQSIRIRRHSFSILTEFN